VVAARRQTTNIVQDAKNKRPAVRKFVPELIGYHEKARRLGDVTRGLVGRVVPGGRTLVSPKGRRRSQTGSADGLLGAFKEKQRSSSGTLLIPARDGHEGSYRRRSKPRSAGWCGPETHTQSDGSTNLPPLWNSPADLSFASPNAFRPYYLQFP